MLRVLRVLWNKAFRREQIDMLLKDVRFHDGTIDIVAQYPGVAIIARELGAYFINQKAVNYCEIGLFDPDTIGFFIVTIQKSGKRSPGSINADLRQALTSIIEHPEQASALATQALQRAGYIDSD